MWTILTGAVAIVAAVTMILITVLFGWKSRGGSKRGKK